MHLFKPKHLTLFMTLFTLTDKSTVIPRTEAGWNQRVSGTVIKDIVVKHYYEKLRPPQKWNYLYIHVESSSIPVYLDFRDESTNKLAYQDRFREFCVIIKSKARGYLERNNPSYKPDLLDNGIADMNYDWFPQMNMIVLSTLLPAYTKWGSEHFKNSQIN